MDPEKKFMTALVVVVCCIASGMVANCTVKVRSQIAQHDAQTKTVQCVQKNDQR